MDALNGIASARLVFSARVHDRLHTAGKADDVMIQHMAARISQRDLAMLIIARPAMSGWMGDVVLKISSAS